MASNNGRLLLHHPRHDPILVNMLRGMQQAWQDQRGRRSLADGLAGNVYTSREQALLGGRRPDRRRDLEDECGYPNARTLDAWFWWRFHLDEPLAGRVNEFMAKQSWQVSPEVYEVERGRIETGFEEALDGLGRQMWGDGAEDFYIDDQGGGALEEVEVRADILSGVGQWGVIVLGLDDGQRLKEPAAGVEERNSASWVEEPGADGKPVQKLIGNRQAAEGKDRYKLSVNQPKTGGRKLLWTMALPEHLARVTRWEVNPTSPRYGQPVAYHCTFNDPESQYVSGIGAPMGSHEVHWSRVVHLADTDHTAGVNHWIAIPRCRPHLRPLLGAAWTRGASHEGYWKMAFPYLFFSTHPQLGGDVEVDEEEMKDLYENLINGLQRSATLKGMMAQLLGGSPSDPRPHRETYIEDICIKGGWPIRVFKGSERGELASTQDDEAWNDEVRRREWGYNSCKVVARVRNRLIMVGVLPRPGADQAENRLLANHLRAARNKRLLRKAPGGWLVLNDVGGPDAGRPGEYVSRVGYRVWWPDISSRTDGERATVAFTRTQAMAQYVSGNVAQLMSPFDYLTRELRFTEEEAEAMLRDAAGEIGGLPEEPEPEGEPTEEFSEPEEPPPNQEQPEDAPAGNVDNVRMCWGNPCPIQPAEMPEGFEVRELKSGPEGTEGMVGLFPVGGKEPYATGMDQDDLKETVERTGFAGQEGWEAMKAKKSHEESKAQTKKARKEEQAEDRAHVKQLQERWTGEKPAHGDEVVTQMPGVGGLPITVVGKVVQAPDGLLEVKIVGGQDKVLGARAKGGQTVSWEPRWKRSSG